MENCIFCKINEKQKVVFRNEYCMFLMQEQEVLIGSGIIVPLSHRKTIFELTQEEWNATYDMLKQVKKYLDNLYHPDGYNIGWNVESCGGQEIFHCHLHVIPRYNEEPLAGKGIRYFLKQKDNMHK